MPACHAGGHEFESRTYRKKQPGTGCFLRFCYTKSSIRMFTAYCMLPMPEKFETKLTAYGAVVLAVADKEAYRDNTRGKAIAKF